jgi:flagellar hook-associated protein 3 FlgL
MRVTNNMMSNSFLRDMNVNLSNMKTIQEQLTSGKEIRKPSDNPFKVARAMQINNDVNTNKQYNQNITDTTNWLDTTDTALGQAGDILQRVRELMVSAGNAAYGTDEKQAIKSEINQKVAELSQVLNTNYDGRYVFGGTRGTSKPVKEVTSSSGNTGLDFDVSAGNATAETNMINSNLTIEISQGVTMDYNVSAMDILKFKNNSGTGKSLVDVAGVPGILTKLANHLDGKTDDGTAVSATATSDITSGDLTDITDAITNLLRVRSEVGAKTNRMESAKAKNEDENFNLTEILSKTEDIDITQKTMEYATMQTVYNASLQTSAKILQPTLMDYLR